MQKNKDNIRLLSFSLDINRQDNWGNTPLIKAVRDERKNKELVKLLLYNPDIKNTLDVSIKTIDDEIFNLIINYVKDKWNIVN